VAGKLQRISWKDWGILVFLCCLAFALRVFRLDERSLWIDEGIMLNQAEQPVQILLGGAEVKDAENTIISLPPLHSIGLAIVKAFGGESVFNLRLVSVWASMLAIPLLFLLGCRLFGRSSGLIAASLGTVSPYLIWYAQAALPESLFITMALLSILSLHRLITDRSTSRGWTAIWLMTNIAVLYCHRAGVWILAFNLVVVVAYILLRRNQPELLAWSVVLLVLSLPQIGQLAESSGLPAGHRPSWYDARALITDQAVDEATSASSEDASSSTFTAALPILRLVPAVLLVLASLIWLLIYPRRTSAWLFAVGLLCLPPILALLGNRLMLHEAESRYALAAIPAVIVLQGAGATALWRHQRPLAVASVVGTITVMVYWTGLQFVSPSFTGEDLKAAAGYVSEGAREEDVVVLHDANTQFVWDHYYNGTAPVKVISHYEDGNWTEALSQFQEIGRDHDRVWLIHRPLLPCELDPDPLIQFGDSQWVKFGEHDFSSPWLDVVVEGYMTAPPVVDSIPEDATPIGLCWPEGLCLHAWSGENMTVGSKALVTLYWSQKHPIMDDYQVELALQDSHRQHWSEYHGLIFPFYPASRWPTGSILKQELSIQISPAIPPENFSLAILVQRASDGQLLAADRTHQGINLIGDVMLARAAQPIPPSSVNIQYKIEAEFGDTVRLLGYSLPNDIPRPGHTGFIDFYWETIAEPAESWWQQTRLIRDGITWVEKVGPLSLAEFDMTEWLTGDLVWGRIFLPLPGQMPPGRYAVEVSLLDQNGNPVPAREFWRAEAADSVTAGPAFLESWPMETTPPEMPHRPDVIFGGAIRLWGYDLQKEVQPGEQLDVTLVWRDELPLEDDFNVFVHLMDEEDTLLGQADGVPVRWTRPTSTWRPGEFIVDHYSIPLPADLSPGVGYLWVGLYHPSGDGRLAVSNPSEGQPTDRTLLDIVVIKQ
jgi:hypothetical protein